MRVRVSPNSLIFGNGRRSGVTSSRPGLLRSARLDTPGAGRLGRGGWSLCPHPFEADRDRAEEAPIVNPRLILVKVASESGKEASVATYGYGNCLRQTALPLRGQRGSLALGGTGRG
jgi:hypothetical protein